MKSLVKLTFVQAEYDGSREDFEESFGISKRERLEFFREVRNRLIAEGKPVADIFVEMIQEDKISGGLLLAMAAFGAQEAWEAHGNGVCLVLSALDEEKS